MPYSLHHRATLVWTEWVCLQFTSTTMGSGSTLNSFGSKLLQLNGSGRESVVRMAHYKGTIVVVKLLSKKGVTFTHVDELEMTAVSFVKAKFHYASWFGAGSEHVRS